MRTEFFVATKVHSAPIAEPESQTLSALCKLPRLHPSITRLLTISGEDDRTLKTFEEVFASDPSLAADLLRAANSVEFGLRAKVTSIPFALMVLGTDRTRSLAMTIAFSKYNNIGAKMEPHGRPIWQHSLATAVVAEEIGACLGVRLTLQYTAGLMHDLGRLGMLMMTAHRYEEVLEAEYLSIQEANELETKLFGMTHARAGSFLAQTWHFPQILCDCVQAHHDVPNGDEPDELHMVQLACIMAAELGHPELPHCQHVQADKPILDHLRSRPELDTARLTELIAQRIAYF